MKRKSRRGFILFFGSRQLTSNDGTAVALDTRCPRCGNPGTLIGKFVRSWFTLFFIPLFPIGAKQRFTQCKQCGASFAMPPEQFAGAAARADAKQIQRGITMYNSLRASPANSITLNDLMQLYATIGEFGQAISAASDFPLALNSSEQCMTTLGRVYLSNNDFKDAIVWFDSALDRNPDLAEAHYYKAVAHLNGAPKNPEAAAIEARAARKADYPGADELLREAEDLARTMADAGS